MKIYFIIIAIFVLSVVIVKSDLGLFDGILTTTAISNINLDKATSGGSITLSEDDLDVTEHGIAWATHTEPTTADYKTELGAGPTTGNSATFSSQMTGLVNGNTYYVRAYITNGDGTFYGDELSFVSVPTLGEWGMIAFASLLAAFGGWIIWRRIG